MQRYIYGSLTSLIKLDDNFMAIGSDRFIRIINTKLW